MIYKELAKELLNIAANNSFNTTFDWYVSSQGVFGFKHKRNYTGWMANPYKGRARQKQGYFDFIIHAGPWGFINHYEFLGEILKKTNLNSCEKVWAGHSPLTITDNEDERVVLITLALLMFEQEVNWGNQSWQRETNFTPDFNKPYFRRPRDMLMGFISIVFANNSVDAILDWNYNKKGGKTTPTFKKEFGLYPNWFKSHFIHYENNVNAVALIITDNPNFQRVLVKSNDNPDFIPCNICNIELSTFERDYCNTRLKYKGKLYCRTHQ